MGSIQLPLPQQLPLCQLAPVSTLCEDLNEKLHPRLRPLQNSQDQAIGASARARCSANL